MAETKKYFHNLDVENNKVMNLLLNPLTTSQRTTVGNTLGVSEEGYVCFDTTLNQQYFWDGTQWIVVGGGGGSQDLQQVTNIGNTTTNSIVADFFQSTAGNGSVYTGNGISYDIIGAGGTISYPTTAESISFPNASGTLALTVNGQSADSAGAITIPVGTGTVTGTGVATRVAFWDTTSSISSDADLYWDNTNNRLGIGTTTPNSTLDANGWINAQSGISLAGSGWSSGVPSSGGKISFVSGTTLKYESVSGSGFSHSFFTNGFSRLYIDDTGIGIGTTSPVYKLDLINTATPAANYARFANDSSNKNAILFSTSTSAAISLTGPSAERKLLIGNGGTGRADFITYQDNYFNFSYSNALGGAKNPLSLFKFTPQFHYSTGTNSHTILDIFPDISITGGTNTLRGVYYNPNNTAGTATTEIAWENTQGDIIHRNLATGGADEMVTVDSIGKLKKQIIPTGGGGVRSINSISTNTTAGYTSGTDYVYLVSGTTTITLPAASGNTSSYTIKRVGTSTVSIATTGGTIDGSSSPITINVQYVSVTLVSDGTNWFII